MSKSTLAPTCKTEIGAGPRSYPVVHVFKPIQAKPFETKSEVTTLTVDKDPPHCQQARCEGNARDYARVRSH